MTPDSDSNSEGLARIDTAEIRDDESICARIDTFGLRERVGHEWIIEGWRGPARPFVAWMTELPQCEEGA